MEKHVLALAAYVAAFVFFIIAAFNGHLSDVNLIAAGLTACAAGFIFDHLP